MAISKIILNGVTQMDLTQDTITAATLMSPQTAHGADGQAVSGTATLTTKSITANGTYNASSDNATGYSSVTVNVSGGGGDSDWVTLVDDTFTINSGNTNYIIINDYTTAIGPGEQYRVTWGNTTYVYISRMTGSAGSYDGYYYGNDYRDGVGDGSPINAFFFRIDSSTLEVVTSDTGNKYLKIEKNTRVLRFQEKTNIDPTSSSQTIRPSLGYDALSSVQINAMPSGTAGTPTATKGTVSNHSVSVTPSVTNTTGYITGSTISGTAVTVSASELVSGSETKTTNGTYDVTNLAELVVNVSGGGSSKNVQVAAGMDRINTTSYTAVSGQSITVAETGTYDVYWTGYRSSTGGTNGSCLYIGDNAHSSGNQTTFTNNGQAIHLTNVSLTKNDVVTVRARARGTSYYMYVGNLTIVQTS